MVGVGFGGAERVTSAHGTLASVEPLGSYPTIDAAAALTRLEAEMSAWMDVGPIARPYPMPADERSSTGDDEADDATDANARLTTSVVYILFFCLHLVVARQGRPRVPLVAARPTS